MSRGDLLLGSPASGQLPQLVSVSAAPGQARSVTQNHSMGSVQEGSDLLDSIGVDDRGSMDAQKTRLIQPRLQPVHLFADQVRLPADMDSDVVAFSFDPVDVGNAQKKQTSARPDH